MRIDQSYFALFGLPERFTLDQTALDAAYQSVQREVHPDRFATAGAAEKRVALQWATRANEGYSTLSDPLSRARYLCELRGADPADEHNTTMPAAFLLEQMEWRESLQATEGMLPAKALAALDRLEAALDDAQTKATASLAIDLDANADQEALHRAVDIVRRMMFMARFRDDLVEHRVALRREMADL